MERAGIGPGEVGPVVDAYLSVARDATEAEVARHWLEKALELCEQHSLGARREFFALQRNNFV